jgi:hypothetical protein
MGVWAKVKYALVGGVAMAFYTEPRFTEDIDLLVGFEDFEKTKGILEKDGSCLQIRKT